MNILYVTFSFTTGGIERLLIDIVNNMAEYKDRKIYLCIINNSYEEELLDEISSKVKIILMNRPINGKKIKYILDYTKMIIREKIDIIHCQMENSVKFSILSKILKPKIKIFTTVHDTKIFTNLKYHEVVMDRIFCNKIIAISDIVKKEILSRGIPCNKVIRLYNAINIDKFYRNTDKPFNKNKIIIGNVSRLLPEKKGQDILIQAIFKLKDRYPDIKCLFAGEVPNNNIKILERLKVMCTSLHLEKNVEFLGNVNDVSGFLDNIDIFVLPSRYEGFGISLIEAMAKGIPCIASNIDGPKEIIKDDNLGLLFESGNAQDLADKLMYRIMNMNINKKLIERYVIDNYEINTMVNKLSEIYRSEVY